MSDPWKPRISPKQDEIVWGCHPSNPEKKKYTLLSGPRKSSKTMGALNTVAMHAWETPRAQISVLAPSISAADDGGSWQILRDDVLPQWLGGGFGMEEVCGVSKPKQSSSKRPYMQVSNKWGGVSTIQLDSMPEEGETAVAKRFKNKQFSMIYWIEVSDWVKNRKSFDVVTDALRGYEDHFLLMLLDTNPAEEGEAHWCYQLFYEDRTATDEELEEVAIKNNVSVESLKSHRDSLGLFEVMIHDNPYLSDKEKAELEAKYIHNQDLVDRYLRGKWTTASGDALFAENFIPELHVIGEEATIRNPNPDIMVPEENCSKLITGWDLGSVNHAACILEQVYRNDTLPQRVQDPGSEPKIVQVSVFKVLDNVFCLNDHDMTIGDFTLKVMERMDYWEQIIGNRVQWEHWSDRSAWDLKNAHSKRSDCQEVYLYSEGEINLKPAEKGDGTVRQRINITRRLLSQDRIFVSARYARYIWDCLQGLKKGKTENQPVQKHSRYKHGWDCLTYPIQMLCYDEIQRMAIGRHVAKRKESSGDGIVSVAFTR